jgi:hypothetical protein
MKTLDEIRTELSEMKSSNITQVVGIRESIFTSPINGDATPEVNPEPKKATQGKAVNDGDSREPSVWKDLLFLVLKIASIVLMFVLLFTFLFGFIRYQEPWMEPAIKDGDLVIFYRYTKSGYLPQDAIALEINGEKQVRRVVATAGDRNISKDRAISGGRRLSADSPGRKGFCP